MKSSLISEIATELSEKYGNTVAARKAEIKSVLQDNKNEIKDETESLGSKQDAEIYVLLNHYCMIGEEFTTGQ